MPSSGYYESLWEGVPAGLEPPLLRPRLAFLLERVRAVGAQAGPAGAQTGPAGAQAGPAGVPRGPVGAQAGAPSRAAPAPVRVLDVGCGEGRFAAALTDAGARVVGIDVAEAPLSRARALRPDLELRRVAVDGPWPLADASFDAVWAGEVIEHVADTAGWLSEVRRVLRSGGSLLLSTPAHGRLRVLGLALSRRAFAAHFDPRCDHLRFYTRASLTGLLADFNFENIEVCELGGVPGARQAILAAARRARY